MINFGAIWPRFFVTDFWGKPAPEAEYEFVDLRVVSIITLIGFYPYYDKQHWSDKDSPDMLLGYSGDENGIVEEFKLGLIPKWLKAKHEKMMLQQDIDEIDYRMWINCL